MTALDARVWAAAVLTAVRRGPRGRSSRLCRAHQAAHHRAAARHDRADDAARRRRHPVAVARRGDPCRRHPRGGQRQHPQLLPRPRHRPGDAPHRASAAGHRPGQSARGAGLRHRARRARRRLAPAHRRVAARGCSRSRRSRSTSVSTRWPSSAAPRRTSCGAVPLAACRCSSAGRPSPGRCRGRRWCSSSSSSSGRRRTTGRWPCASATTTPRPACRCSRSSRRRRPSPARWSPTAG